MDQRSRVLMAAVLGAGVVIGTAGVFIYNQLFGEQRQRMAHHAHEIRKLDQTVAEIRAELLLLQRRRTRHRTETDSEPDMFSAIGTDDEDDEFYDLSDDELDEIEPSEGQECPPLLVTLFSRVDKMINGTEEDRADAHEQMLEHLEAFPDSGDLLWRLARSNHFLAKTEVDAVNRARLLEQGINYGRRSVESSPRSAEAHKWMAILVGLRAEGLGTKEKIQDGFVFQKHVEEALRLAPANATLHHLAGRFKYEVASLSWVERKVAATLFAEPPTATYADAESHFLQAEELSDKPWRENKVLLAKTNAALGDFGRALFWLNESLNLPLSAPEDGALETEARQLAAKYTARRT